MRWKFSQKSADGVPNAVEPRFGRAALPDEIGSPVSRCLLLRVIGFVSAGVVYSPSVPRWQSLQHTVKPVFVELVFQFCSADTQRHLRVGGPTVIDSYWWMIEEVRFGSGHQNVDRNTLRTNCFIPCGRLKVAFYKQPTLNPRVEKKQLNLLLDGPESET